MIRFLMSRKPLSLNAISRLALDTHSPRKDSGNRAIFPSWGDRSYTKTRGGWPCAEYRAKQAADQYFKKRVAQVEAEISQQKI